MRGTMPMKRKSTMSYAARAKRARMNFKTTRGTRALLSRNLPPRFGGPYKRTIQLVAGRVNSLYRMIESKQFTWRTSADVALPHNNVLVVQQQSGGPLNPFRSANSTDEPMGVGGSRIGDQISVKGLMIKAFFENALDRSKVFYRVMLVKTSKGDTIDRSTLFKGDSNNKMIDQVNNERHTIIAQKSFSISPPNATATSVLANGVGYMDSAAPRVTTGQKIIKMWIPGYKLARNGQIQFENASQTQVKHFDYRIVVLAYDWYGTPQDANNVGKINEMYTKVYFKDA